MRLLVLVALAAAIASVRANPLPDLAQLKLAAEAGDAIAEFEYGSRIYEPNERLDWFLKSARQGYAPAQDGAAGMLDSRITSKPDEKKACQRAAAVWASRAAYQGYPSAQGKLGVYYDRGIGVARDPLKAYMWCQIQVQTIQAKGIPFTDIVAKTNRDSLIRKTPSATIALGQKLAEEFQPMQFTGMNPVEADLVFAELNLASIFRVNGTATAVVNGVRFTPKESHDITIDGHPQKLTCLGIDAKAAAFAIAGTNYQVVLQLKH